MVYRTERTRTTWAFRLALLTIVVVALWMTRGWWTVAVASSLICEPGSGPSDAILVDNFDTEYLVFERARDLRRAGLAPRVLVPITAGPRPSEPNDVELGFAQVMAKVARLGSFDVVPTRDVEPVALNVARDVLRYVERERIDSVILVAPLFRSRRSSLVYGQVLAQAGVTVYCEPARGVHDEHTWTRTWHGIQGVLLQWFKLQYYRLYVMPRNIS